MDKQDETKKEAPPHKVKKRKKPGFSFLNLNLLLSIAIIVAVSFISYIGWKKNNQQQSIITAQQQQLEQIRQQQAQVDEQVQKQLQQNTVTQNQELNTLKETITAFLKQNQYSRRDWLIAEAEYLIKLANHRLVLVRDVTTSINALRAADDRLREVGNPRFIPLRQALAVDIQQLNSVPVVDIVGLSLKLNAIQKQIEALPLKTPDPKTIEQKNQQTTQLSQVDGWKNIPAAIWQDLLKLFQVQRHNERVQPLLSPEHRFFLVQNVKLQLEQARLALLNNQPVIYKDRIQQAQQWIKRYFDNQHSLSQSVNKHLTELAQAKLNIKLPDISSSLIKLQLISSGNNQPEKPKSKIKKPTKKKKVKKNKLIEKKPAESKLQKKIPITEIPTVKNKPQANKPEKTDKLKQPTKPVPKENNGTTI
ncbi:hypothetical protein MNBD_GAMMA23-2492 [hydrothermal vent metagenome]|uniref:Uroporphyrinogen-III C-methyltransferase n=1 Tax=hydrothermal vent metagenome TaxID=652676 RepID=A0A3B0ZXK1_9ZZZZ